MGEAVRTEATVAFAESDESSAEIAVWRGRSSLTVRDSTFDSAMVYLTPAEARTLAQHLRAAAVAAGAPDEE